MRNKTKWEPAKPLRRPDNIGSSDFDRSTPQFIPSYEKSPQNNMHFLLGMEYSRMWHEERVNWNRQMFPPQEKAYFMRKYVIRGRRNKFPPKPPLKPFKMKRFMDIPSKVDHRRTPKNKEYVADLPPSSRPATEQCPCPEVQSDAQSLSSQKSNLTVARGAIEADHEDNAAQTPFEARSRSAYVSERGDQLRSVPSSQQSVRSQSSVATNVSGKLSVKSQRYSICCPEDIVCPVKKVEDFLRPSSIPKSTKSIKPKSFASQGSSVCCGEH